MTSPPDPAANALVPASPESTQGQEGQEGPESPERPEGPAGPETPEAWDCQACGACCRNLDTNQASGVRYWVEIASTDKILTRQDLVRKLVTYDRARVPHLRMTHDGTCEALRGAIGGHVRCSIYHQRPSPCRRVMPGDDTCLRSRAACGL